jgi:hypothetical protein
MQPLVKATEQCLWSPAIELGLTIVAGWSTGVSVEVLVLIEFCP